YLTGYDVQTINLRDILVGGNLPATASAGQDPSDTISPKGVFSQDINFASCNGVLPPPALTASVLQHVQLSLTGQPSPFIGNLCSGRALGDNVARGYITVDAVSDCTIRKPSDAGYFAAGGTGDATDQNVLWGDYFYLNPATGAAEGNPLVHIVADATDPETTTPGEYTFYGRYVGWAAADKRPPLAAHLALRHPHRRPLPPRAHPLPRRRLLLRRPQPHRLARFQDQSGALHLSGRHRPSELVSPGPGAARDLRRAGAGRGAAQRAHVTADHRLLSLPRRSPARRRRQRRPPGPVQLRLDLSGPEHHGHAGGRRAADRPGGGAGVGRRQDGRQRAVQRRLRRHPARQRRPRDSPVEPALST